MKHRKLYGMLATGLVGGASAFSLAFVGGHHATGLVPVAQADQSVQSQTPQSVQQALSGVTFGSTIKKPSFLPFGLIGSYATVTPLSHGHAMVDITYVGKSNQTLTLTISDANIQTKDKSTPSSVDVAKAIGNHGAYRSNGWAQMLDWHQDGLWYMVEYSTPGKQISAPLQISTIQQIANSLS